MKKRFKKLMAVALSSAIALNSFAPSLAEEEGNVVETDIQAVEAVEEPDAMEVAAEEPEAAVEETQAPATEAVTEVPVTEAPATEAPVTEAPMPETPAPEVPEEATEVTNTPLAEPETQVTEGDLEEETTPMPDTEPATEGKEETQAPEEAPEADLPDGADDAEGWTDGPAGTEDAAEGPDVPAVEEVPDTQETEPPAYWLTAEAGGMSFTLSAMDGSAFPDGAVLEVQDTAQFCQEAGFDAEQQEALGLLGLSQLWEGYASEAGIPGEEMPESFAGALLAQDGFWVTLTDADGNALGGTYVLEAETQDAETYRLVKSGAVVEAIPFDVDWDIMPAPEDGFLAGAGDGSLCVYWEGFRPCYFQLAILDPEWQMPEAETETPEEETEAPDGELNTEPGVEAETETETETEAVTEEGAEAGPEDMGNPYEGSMALAELAGLDDETAGAATEWAPPQAGVRRMMARALSDWSFDAYYVNQEDSSHVDKTDDFSLKYQFEFHNSRDLEAFTVSIRIPETLYADRFGKGLVPSDIGVPQGRPEEGSYTKTVSSPFNYYREDGDLVFFNYRQMRSGTNAAVQVLYKNIQALDTIDGSTWSLQPEASVTGEDGVETRQGTPLTGSVDTKAELSSVTKEAKKVAGKSYTPGLYTRAQVENYLAPGSLPEKCSTDFDRYVYVLWESRITGEATQAWELSLEDATSCSLEGETYDGEVLGLRVKTGNGWKMAGKLPDGTWDVASYLEDAKGRKNFSLTVQSVCAYPKQYVKDNGTVFTNHASATLHPADGLDADTKKEAQAGWSWSDYKWTYGGDVIGVRKYTGASGTSKDRPYSNWLDVYRAASGQGAALGGFPFRVEGYCKGYGYTHGTSGPSIGNYVAGSYYEVTTVDDALYAYPLDGELAGEGIRLGYKDYYFSGITIQQKDAGYDVFEDVMSEVEPEEATGSLDRGLTVYAMYEGDSTWEEVSYVPWDGKGDLYYHFTPEQVSRRPWRVKAVHNAVDYTSECFMDLNAVIRPDSPVFAQMLESGVTQARVENLDGIFGRSFTKEDTKGTWFHDQSTTGGTNYSEEGLAELTEALYGVICMRDSAFVTLDGLGRHAQAQKYAKAYNDSQHGRVGLSYTVSAYEGYELYGKEAVPYLELAGVPLPKRAGMVFYDLLPYGVQFDPSVPVTAGRLTGCSDADLGKPSRWDPSGVSVTVDPERDVIPDWRDTGRTMVAFHVSYGGADPSVFTAYGGESIWMDGYGVSFGAYCSWADAKAAEQTPNVCAVLPETSDTEPYLARENEAYQDNGSGTGDYAVFGTDLNDDGITEIRHVLYAKAKAFEEIAIATQSGIEKSVRADSDRFGEFTRQAAVGTGEGYTYDLTVTNASRYPLHDVVVFDRLENAAKDRAGTEETMPFGDTWWEGSLRRVDTSAAEELGVRPVIYYSADRDAVLPQGSQDPSDVLTAENGWTLSSAWTKPVSEVKALAVDLRLTEGGEAFQLGNMESVTFRICMDAPPAMPEAKYAYNNPSFFSITDGLTPDDTVAHTVAGNSVRVKLEERAGVEVIKRLAGEKAGDFREEEFPFTACLADGEEETPYASREYALYQEKDGAWELKEALLATDAGGRFFLHADEKAVFREAADAGSLVIREEEDPRFHVEAEEHVSGGLRTLTFTNEPQPVVYLAKNTAGVPEGMDLTETTFRIQVAADGAPLAGNTYWIVEQAEPYGTAPVKLGEGKTDENGCLTIHAGETLALFPGSFGTAYTVTEQPDSYGDGTDWTCRKPEVSGVADTYVKNAQIENIYKWRDLYLTKELTHQDPEDCKEAFSFRFWELGDGASFDPENPEATARLLTGLSWELLGADRKPLEEPVTGTTGEGGVLSCMCAGKVIHISGLEAGKTIVAQEVDIPEHYAAVNEGIAEVQMPVYAPSANMKLTNDCLLRDLRVSKLVVPKSNDGLPVYESYTATSPNWPDNYPANMTEAANFQEFTLKGAEAVMVTFSPDCGTESNCDFVRVYDANGKNVSGNLSSTSFAGKTVTVPGDYVKITMSSDPYVEGKGYSCKIEPVYGNANDDSVTVPFEMKLSIKDGGSFQPGSGIPYVIERSGESTYEGVTGEDGSFSIRGSETAVFRYLGEAGLEYQVMETPDADCPPVYPAEGEAAEGILDKDGGKVVMINGSQGNLVIRKEYAAKDGDKAGEYLADGSLLGKGLLDTSFTIETMDGDGGWNQPGMDILLIDSASGDIKKVHTGQGNPVLLPGNWIAVASGLPAGTRYRVRETGEYQHRTAYDAAHRMWLWFDQAEPAGDQAFEGVYGEDNAVIVNQIHSFQVGSRIYKKMTEDSSTVPAGAELVLRVERYDGTGWTPASGVRYLTSAGDVSLDCDDVLATGGDGLVRIRKREDGLVPSVHFASAVKLNLKEGMKAGDLRAVEVPELSHPSYGYLLGYSSTDYYYESSQDVADMELSPEFANIFINSNVLKEVEIEKAMDGEDPHDFTMILTGGSIGTGEDAPAAGLPYTVYGSETNGLVREGVTTKNGEFTLKAGQYARFLLQDGSHWNVREAASYPYSLKEAEGAGENLEVRADGSVHVGLVPNAVNGSLTREMVTFGVYDPVTGEKINLTEGDVVIPEVVYYQGKVIRIRQFEYRLFFNSRITGISFPEGISIGDSLFENSSSLAYVNIPDGVTRIGRYAFDGCSSLAEINIPESVTSIEDHAFSGCSSLTSINIPESVTSIGTYAFSGCSSLANITIPDGVTNIKNGTFENCSSLTDIVIPDGVTSIGYYAFAYCNNLEKVFIPNSVVSIDPEAFYRSSSSSRKQMTIYIDKPKGGITGEPWGDYLSSIIWAKGMINDGALYYIPIGDSLSVLASKDPNVKNIEVPQSINGVPVTAIEQSAFASYVNLQSVKIPDSVTSIGYRAFYDCSSLVSINIPDGVTRIANETFIGCSSLTSVDIPDSVTSIGRKVFQDCSNLTSIDIPDSVEGIGEAAFHSCSSLANIDLPSNITSIEAFAFYNCSSLAEINIPESVTSIGDDALYGCSSLAEINIPDGVTSIGYGAFNGCSSLAEINIPNGVTSIESDTFSRCVSLASIDIPDGITSIGDRAFASCRCLKLITIPSGVTYIGSDALKDTNAVVFIDRPKYSISGSPWGASLSKIIWSDSAYTEDDTFYYKDEYGKRSVIGLKDLNAKNVTIPDGVSYIDEKAFYGCENLESVIIPEGLTAIYGYAFSFCTNLKSVIIPDSVNTIRELAFEGCENLISIDLPANLEYISYGMLKDCRSLTKVSVPDGINTVGVDAFYGCDNLERVSIPDSVNLIGPHAFYGCKSLKDVKIPDNVRDLPIETFKGCSSLSRIDISPNITDISTDVFAGCDNLMIWINKKKGSISGAPWGAQSSNIIWFEGDMLEDENFYYSYSTYAYNSLAILKLKNLELENVEVPANVGGVPVKEIAPYAFKHCSNIKTATLPNGMVRIGTGAFSYCENLTDIHIPDGPLVEDGAFANCTSLKEIDYPKYTQENIGTPIMGGVFFNCTSLERVELPDDTFTIGGSCFGNCTSLKQFFIPDTVQQIGNGLFQGCTGLEYVKLPNISSYAYLGGGMFYGCEKLKEITIPSNVRTAPSSFEGSFVETLTFEDGYKVLTNSCLAYMNSLVTVNLPESITEIGHSAFYSCPNLKNINVPDGVKTIASHAFDGCRSLEHIHLPKNLKVLDAYVFNGCENLKELEIPEGVTDIYGFTINGCDSLKRLTIPSTVRDLDNIFPTIGTAANISEIIINKPEGTGIKSLPKNPITKIIYIG